MSPERLEELKKWIIQRGRPWGVVVEDDKVRIMTNIFIMDFRITRDIEGELNLRIDDIMSHATYGMVMLCTDLDKSGV